MPKSHRLARVGVGGRPRMEVGVRDRGGQKRALTQQHGRDAPAQSVIEAHGTAVHVARLNLHAVEVQPLHEEPGEGAQEKVVQQDGDGCAQQLRAQWASPWPKPHTTPGSGPNRPPEHPRPLTLSSL